MMEQHFMQRNKKLLYQILCLAKNLFKNEGEKKKTDICGKKQMLTEFTVTRPHLGLKEAEKSKISTEINGTENRKKKMEKTINKTKT